MHLYEGIKNPLSDCDLPFAGALAAASETAPGFVVGVAQPVDERVSC